jgi:hypothetical protein
MAIDLKYGKVTMEKGDVGEDEPVIVFRSQDILLPKLLAYYLLLCLKAGSPRHHLNAIMNAREAIMNWQKNHHTQVPRSDSLRDEVSNAG